jgi:hypothetical protein
MGLVRSASASPSNPLGLVSGRQRRVGLVGALGGFVLPIIFDIVLDWLGINSSSFMFLYSVVWVSLILNYTTEVRRLPVMGPRMCCGLARHAGSAIMSHFLDSRLTRLPSDKRTDHTELPGPNCR